MGAMTACNSKERVNSGNYKSGNSKKNLIINTTNSANHFTKPKGSISKSIKHVMTVSPNSLIKNLKVTNKEGKTHEQSGVGSKALDSERSHILISGCNTTRNIFGESTKKHFVSSIGTSKNTTPTCHAKSIKNGTNQSGKTINQIVNSFKPISSKP
jgi:hypothetical protein